MKRYEFKLLKSHSRHYSLAGILQKKKTFALALRHNSLLLFLNIEFPSAADRHYRVKKAIKAINHLCMPFFPTFTFPSHNGGFYVLTETPMPGHWQRYLKYESCKVIYLHQAVFYGAYFFYCSNNVVCRSKSSWYFY